VLEIQHGSQITGSIINNYASFTDTRSFQKHYYYTGVYDYVQSI